MSIPESFEDRNELTAQGRTWATLTPSDDTDLPFIPKAVHISGGDAGGGSFTAIGHDDVEAPFFAAPGDTVPIRPKRIKATGITGNLTFTGLRT